MWQYTTETIINSEKGKLFGGVRFGVFGTGKDEEGNDAVVARAVGAVENNDSVLIDGVLSARVCDIARIIKTGYRDEAMAAAHIDLATAGYAKGDVLRLKVVLHQQGQVSSIFQNAYLKHNKPFFFEIVASDDAATGAVADAKALVKVINRELNATDFHFFKATVAEGASVINFEGADCYIRFTEIQLAKVEADSAATGAALLGYENYTKLADGVPDTVGSEGMGTVRQLVKNLRVPTCANVDPFGVDFGGKPVPGGQYDQYLIELVSDRRHVGGQVMGSYNDKSITSHVFFINKANSALNDAWETFVNLLLEKGQATEIEQGDKKPAVAKTEIGSVQ